VSGELVPREQSGGMMRALQNRELGRVQRQLEVGMAQENGRAIMVQARLQNGSKLTYQAVQAAKMVHSSITDAAKDDPGLEMELRALEAALVKGMEFNIFQYMTH
jgi:hypothetical protein